MAAPGARRGWAALWTAGMGSFVAAFDGSAVSIALPELSSDLSANLSQVQWVIAAYLIVSTAMLLNAGRVADVWGLRRVYGVGLLGFALASLLCGASGALWPLVGARALQGAFAALVMANGPALVAASFPPGRSARGLGLLGAAMAGGLMAGPPVGGVVIDLLSWRWIFFANVPLGAMGAFLALRGGGPPGKETRGRFDLAGGGLLVLVVGALFGGVSELGRRGAPPGVAPALLALAAAAALFFAWVERRALRPVIRERLLVDRVVGPAVLCEALGFVAVGAVTFLAPFYLAVVRGLRPVEVGSLFGTVPIALAAAAFFSGFGAARVGARRLRTLGLGACAGGLGALAFAGTGGPVTDALLPFLAIGAGVGLFQTPNSSMAFAAAPAEDLGATGGLLATARNLGMAVGVAVGSGVFQAGYRARTGVAVEQLEHALARPFALSFGAAMLAAATCALCAALISALASRPEPSWVEKGRA